MSDTLIKRKSIKAVLTMMIIVFSLLIFWYLKSNSALKNARVRNFNKQLGTYILDIDKTNLGSYKNDSGLYSNLKITFNKDSTFIMNMKVPFLYDSVGRWLAAGTSAEEWNRLYFKSWEYTKYDNNTGAQFTQPWTKDSIFYINGATPQNDQKFIQEIYFRKIFLK